MPFTRLFLTLDELDTDSANLWDAHVGLNLDRAPGQVNEHYDYIALADHDPKGDAYAYLYNQWQVVRDLGPQLSYRTGTLCKKWLNWNLPVVDLDALEKMYIFYGRWDKDKDKYVIVGNPAS